MLKISKSMASLTVGSSSPTYKEAEGVEATEDGGGGLYAAGAGAAGAAGAPSTAGATAGAADISLGFF
jgi:hypothetical protein